MAGCVLLMMICAAGCGYRVAGRGSSLPAEWKTIAVPAIENRTTRFRIEQRLREALVRELLARTAYRVVPEETGADAVLHGEVSSVEASAALYDRATGRATTMLVSVRLKVRMTERGTNRVFFQNDNFLFREPYEISTDINSFFDEQEPALERLARDFAARLVSAILEKF